MRSARFFRVVWNINSILFLVAGAGVLLLLAFVAWQAVASTRNVSGVVNLSPKSEVTVHWQFGTFGWIDGTHYLMAPIRSEQGWQRGSYSDYDREATAARNYLFINAVDKTSHYLLPGNEKMVLEMESLRRGAGDNKPVQWLYCRVVDADTNGDGRLTDADGFAVAFANPDGTGFQEVVPNVTAILGRARPSDDKMLLFYTTKGRSLVSEINIPERRLVTTKELPPLPSL